MPVQIEAIKLKHKKELCSENSSVYGAFRTKHMGRSRAAQMVRCGHLKDWLFSSPQGFQSAVGSIFVFTFAFPET